MRPGRVFTVVLLPYVVGRAAWVWAQDVAPTESESGASIDTKHLGYLSSKS